MLPLHSVMQFSWRHGKMDKKLCSSAQLDSEETSIPENFNYFIILFQTSRVGETPSIQNPWIWENLIDQSYLTSRLSENSFFRCCKLLKPSLSAASFAGSWTGSPEYISGISGSGIWFHQDQFLSKKRRCGRRLNQSIKEIWWMYTSVHTDKIYDWIQNSRYFSEDQIGISTLENWESCSIWFRVYPLVI